MIKFSDLVGMTMTKVVRGPDSENPEIHFSSTEGRHFKLYHDQD